jgi:hypothetical protein
MVTGALSGIDFQGRGHGQCLHAICQDHILAMLRLHIYSLLPSRCADLCSASSKRCSAGMIRSNAGLWSGTGAQQERIRAARSAGTWGGISGRSPLLTTPRAACECVSMTVSDNAVHIVTSPAHSPAPGQPRGMHSSCIVHASVDATYLHWCHASVR